MNRILILFTLIFFLTKHNTLGQSAADSTYSVVSVVSPHEFILDGRIMSKISGHSRTTLQINLPEGTQRWYYSFAATEGENSLGEWISLAGQLTRAYDKTGIVANVVDKLVKPSGSAVCDIYVIDTSMMQEFEAKNDKKWKYDGTGSRLNLKSGPSEQFPKPLPAEAALVPECAVQAPEQPFSLRNQEHHMPQPHDLRRRALHTQHLPHALPFVAGVAHMRCPRGQGLCQCLPMQDLDCKASRVGQAHHLATTGLVR